MGPRRFQWLCLESWYSSSSSTTVASRSSVMGWRLSASVGMSGSAGGVAVVELAALAGRGRGIVGLTGVVVALGQGHGVLGVRGLGVGAALGLGVRGGHEGEHGRGGGQKKLLHANKNGVR